MQQMPGSQIECSLKSQLAPWPRLRPRTTFPSQGHRQLHTSYRNHRLDRNGELISNTESCPVLGRLSGQSTAAKGIGLAVPKPFPRIKAVQRVEILSIQLPGPCVLSWACG